MNDHYPCVGQFEKSNYFTTDQFSDILNASPVSLSVLCLNIRSFDANADKLISMMDSFSKCPDVLVLICEIWRVTMAITLLERGVGVGEYRCFA